MGSSRQGGERGLIGHLVLLQNEDTQKTSQVLGTPLVVQWLRLGLPMQGVQV